MTFSTVVSARTTCDALIKLGVEVGCLGPGSLVPKFLPTGVKRFTQWDEAMAWGPDFLYLLRVQLERQDVQYFPNQREYTRLFGLTNERLQQIRDAGIYLMHPGPVNRGVELTDAAMEYERCLINTQVENGVATRMSTLWWVQPER